MLGGGGSHTPLPKMCEVRSPGRYAGLVFALYLPV